MFKPIIHLRERLLGLMFLKCFGLIRYSFERGSTLLGLIFFKKIRIDGPVSQNLVDRKSMQH